MNEITPETKMKIGDAVRMVENELASAMCKHPPINSLHEAYAVILEEVDEFWQEVKKRSSDRSRHAISLELRQIAAMAIRASIDLDLIIACGSALPLNPQQQTSAGRPGGAPPGQQYA